jgi:LmbE family N-acetylglucosaminyl deacetylase
MTEPRLLGNFAHRDDEGVMGAAFLQYTDAGVDTGLICATRGEAGEIADPALATAENLGEVREAELRCAAEVLAIDDLWLLPFRDSGMATTLENGIRSRRSKLRCCGDDDSAQRSLPSGLHDARQDDH